MTVTLPLTFPLVRVSWRVSGSWRACGGLTDADDEVVVLDEEVVDRAQRPLAHHRLARHLLLLLHTAVTGQAGRITLLITPGQ